MTNEEREAIKQTVAEMMKNARESVEMAEHYEGKARTFLVPAHFMLKSVGIDKTTEELRAMISKREHILCPAEYANLAVREIFGEEETGAENA